MALGVRFTNFPKPTSSPTSKSFFMCSVSSPLLEKTLITVLKIVGLKAMFQSSSNVGCGIMETKWKKINKHLYFHNNLHKDIH